MRVEQAVVETDGMSYLVLVVDGCDWRVGPELKGTLLMDGVVPVCVDRGAEPYAEIPADPANGRPHVERAAGLCDDPIVYTLAARYWLDVWRDTIKPGPSVIPSREEAEIEAPNLREIIRQELKVANGW